MKLTITMMMALFVGIGLAVGPAFAALSESIVNGDLETDDIGGGDNFYPGGGYVAPAGPTGWSTGENQTSLTRLTNTTTSGILPTPWQIMYTGFDWATNTAGDKVWSFQSLGTVDITDQGLSFSFSANGVANKKIALSDHYGGEVEASFRTGVTGGDNGVEIGSSSEWSFGSNVDTGGLFNSTGDATYAPTSADIGKEIFVVVSSTVTNATTNAAEQGPGIGWDDAVLGVIGTRTVIPEPATLTLLGVGGLTVLRRRR